MTFSNYLPKSRLLDDRWPFIVLALAVSLAVIATSGLLDVEYDSDYTIVKGKVVSADDSKLSADPYVNGMYIGKQPVVIKLLTGDHKGESFCCTSCRTCG